MYSLNNEYKKSIAPWEISLNFRCSLLKKYIENGYMISILIYEYPDTSTFRYRAYNLAQITQFSSKSQWKCVYFYRHELNIVKEYLNKIHLITIIRVRWNQDLDDFIVTAKYHNIKVLFDVDDLVFDLNYLPLVHNTLNVNSSEVDYDFWFAYISRIGFTASKADGFITPTNYLGKILKDKFQKEFCIIPNFINQEQLEISQDLCVQKAKTKNIKPFTIGYFSGTPSHINDFKVVYKELCALLSDFKINLLVVGFMEFPFEMQEFIRKNQIIYTPLVDFIELQRQIAQVDVNIVPLVNNTFTNCKSELKYFEAAIVNTITFATPIFSYKNRIEDGKNGYLCKEGEWYEKIAKYFNDEMNKKEIIKRAYDNAICNYSGDFILNEINKVYNFFYNL
jgi:glycosyltransferase involved in cell wall biosynthesis